MPYKIYKKQYGYKVCKKGGEKCFSKKPMSKAKAKKQMGALYASENQQLTESLDIFPDEAFLDIDYIEGEDVVVYRLNDGCHLSVSVTENTDPTFKISFKNPQMVRDVLNKLTLDDVVSFGEDAIDRVDGSQSNSGDLKFESLFKKTIE